jgi:hypothetical protein
MRRSILSIYQQSRLLEDLAVGPVVLLAVGLDRLVPGPHVVNELLVLRLGGVKLGELVALVVGSNVEGLESVLATDEESSADDRVVGDTVNRAAAEEVFAAGLETVEEATYSPLAYQIRASRQPRSYR